MSFLTIIDNYFKTKKMLKQIIKYVRKIIGTDKIILNQERNRKQLLLISNAIVILMQEKSSVKESIIYKKTNELKSLLSPKKVLGFELIRVGKKNDGGYVMLNNNFFKSSSIAYSFGISDDTSWDQAIANLGKDIYMYDHTIDKLPTYNPKFNFFKIGLTGSLVSPNLKTIEELLIINNHQDETNLLMKMDIEDCEWDVFNTVSSDILNQFSQIVLEFHNLSPFLDNAKYKIVVDVLKKINLTHQSVHIHANTELPVPHIMLDIVLPELLEVTFVRKKDIVNNLQENDQIYPLDIDESTFQNNPDLFLGKF